MQGFPLVGNAAATAELLQAGKQWSAHHDQVRSFRRLGGLAGLTVWPVSSMMHGCVEASEPNRRQRICLSAVGSFL